MRAHRAPKLYQRGDVWWCYWRDDRWSTKQTDEREAARIVREHYDPRVTTSREKVVEDAIGLLYEALERRGRAEATRGQARQKLGHFARLWAGKPLSEINWALMQSYIKERLEVDEVERLTVSHEIGYLRQAWKLARAEGWCSRGWDEIMPERFDRGYRPRTRWLPPRELEAVLRSLPERQAAIVAWIVATGSDVGDFRRARAGDYDRKRQLVHVRGTKTVFRDRHVPVTALTKPLLEFACIFGPPFDFWSDIGQKLGRLALRLGIAHFSPKDLRRTHGQWLRGAGVHPHLIGRVLGHADSAMADKVYAQGEDEALAKLVRMGVGKRTSGVRMGRTSRSQRAAIARKSR